MNGSEDVRTTPDGRYIVVRGRLWRKTNPYLSENERKRLVGELMSARRMVKEADSDPERLLVARKAVDAAKVALGERGPVWWTDGAPDLNRHMVHTTSYAGWFAGETNAAGLSTVTSLKAPFFDG